MITHKKIFLISTLVVLIIAAAVLAQSFVRRNQTDRILTQIKESLLAAKQTGDPKALATLLLNSKDELDFIQKHRPILNVRAMTSSADGPGGPDSEWCNFLFDEFYDPWVGAITFNYDKRSYQEYILRLLKASGCEF